MLAQKPGRPLRAGTRGTYALLYRTLATLRRDVPLTQSVDDLEWKGVDEAVWSAWCDDVGASSLRARPRRKEG